MFAHKITFGLALLIVALPAAAQQRGTLEVGGFGSFNTFDKALEMDNAAGFGGRFGAYLSPRWLVEFEGNTGRAGRPRGLADRTFRFLDGRVVVVPVTVQRLGLLLGAGVNHIDAHVNHDFTNQSYGFHGLVGGKIRLSERAALRVDYARYFQASAQHGVLKAGLSLALHPNARPTAPAPVVAYVPMRADSVSADETRRLRAEAAALASLRDSLARSRGGPRATTNAGALSTMLDMIHFDHDASSLNDVARNILNDKVAIFNANPDMKIVITGYTSAPGTEAYNMALGFRRATEAKAYLVSRGIAQERIEITTRGENNLLIDGPGEAANAANRRGQFRLLIADPYLISPRD